MKITKKIVLAELQGVAMRRPMLKYLVGGCESEGCGSDGCGSDGCGSGGCGSGGCGKIYNVCCRYVGKPGCSSEFTSPVCDGDLCGNRQPYNCW